MRHSIDVSLYNDITIERCVQILGMMRENAKAKITLHPILSNSDSPQKSPMPIHRSFHSTQSCANVAPRLFASLVHLLIFLLRIITSHNDTASIVAGFVVSTSKATHHLIMLHAVTLARHETIL